MHTEREPTARPHPIRIERAVHRLRRHVIPSALIVGGVGLAAADVSAGIGWGLAVVGAALALQPQAQGPTVSDAAGGLAGVTGARPRSYCADR